MVKVVSLLALLTQIYLIIGVRLIALTQVIFLNTTHGSKHADLSLSDKAEEYSLLLKEKHVDILPSIFCITLLRLYKMKVWVP